MIELFLLTNTICSGIMIKTLQNGDQTMNEATAILFLIAGILLTFGGLGCASFGVLLAGPILVVIGIINLFSKKA